MAIIPEITCRRCGCKYSGLRNRCPKCGATCATWNVDEKGMRCGCGNS